MFRNFFGSQGWERLGTRLKEKTRGVLNHEFEDFEQLMKTHRVFDHPYFQNSRYGSHAVGQQVDVLALIFYEKALEGILKSGKLDHPQSKTMSSYSIKLDNSDSNPAWMLESVFMAGDDSVSTESLHKHMPRALYASDNIESKYRDLLNVNAPEVEGMHLVRASLLYLTLEQRVVRNLEDEDLATLIAALELDQGGTNLKKALHGHLGHNDLPSEVALHFANRVLAHSVYLIGGQLMQNFRFKTALPFLKCAAAINPHNYSARIDLAQFLHDANRAVPEEGHGHEAVRYAHEVILLIEKQAYDLSPEIPIGYSTYGDKIKLSEDLAKMHEILNAYEA